MTNKYNKWMMLLWVGMVWLVSLAAAADEKPSEYLVKATFLYHFARFVDWDLKAFENDESPVILCILGDDPFGESLNSIENKPIGKRLLRIRRGGRDSLAECHIIFVSDSEKGNLTQIMSDIKHPCLTVGDMDEFTRHGGIIKFFTMENKIRFEVNLDAANRARIRISSRLLKIARIFKE